MNKGNNLLEKFFIYDKEFDIWVGVDNSSGDYWVEEFDKFKDCYDWLDGKSIDDIR